jgi:adenine-specific DNA-methyltransferase
MIHHGDCLAVMRQMPNSSVDLIATDPPYFKVKGEAWDWQWNTPTQFLSWMGELCDEWQRILKPNGSLYVFASPRMAWGVEGEVRKRFAVLNNIRWQKPPFSTKAEMCVKEDLRTFFPASETIIFAEQVGADNMAKGEAGYVAKCDELRGFVFEPLRSYLAGERDRAGWTTRRVAEAFQVKTGSRTVTGMAGHWFEQVQWTLPTRQNYEWLRELFAGDYLRREYDDLRREYDDLRREYDDLRREYDDLRRPFTVTADVPYTDVWSFKTVSTYPGKHPCEKPLDLMRHIVAASSRPGGVVLDCFCGSGSTLEAAASLGRQYIGIDADEKWCEWSRDRLSGKDTTMPLFAEAS